MVFSYVPPVPTSIPANKWPTLTDERDERTSDDWVHRLPSLIRLTGRHPFNAESHTKDLVDAGFITPVPMHYVRNHGPVPKLTWEDHRICISGLGLAAETSICMDELISLPIRTIPVTLVCAGNRRKEVNVTKQSKGFSWGAGAVSTGVWTGVPLHVLLKHCGIKPEEAGPDSWVTFDGPDGELPKGVYGTSVPLRRALDPAQDILIAFEQNGERLSPDHGYPVRIIIPGYIGGRMIKWLTKITVSKTESDSFYHYHDNRVLPSFVEHERADKEGWWRKPEYIINELNLNSAITHPAHGEELPLDGIYKVKGYAYCGGGRRVHRVELSLDNGETWELANLSNEEYPTEHGRFWCWRMWSFDVDVVRMTNGKGLALRAWDDSQNTQPRDLTWNVLGMMNNSWYKLRTSVRRNDRNKAIVYIEHPAPMLIGNLNVGWMIKDKEGHSVAEHKSVPVPQAPIGGGADIAPSKDGGRLISPAEVAKHNTKTDCWIIVKNNVYNVTSYLKEHPGGIGAIVMNGGRDCTEDFEAIHSTKAWDMLAQFQVGVLDTAGASSSTSTSTSNGGGAEVIDTTGPALTGRGAPVNCRLIFKEYEANDVLRLRFALPYPEQSLGLAVGLHLGLRAKINGRTVMRSYTPVSDPEDKGMFELLVKVYRANQHPKFPEGGLMSQYLDRMAIGSFIEVEGPLGCLIYEGPGCLSHLNQKIDVEHFAAVAGGTGITPIIQVLNAIIKNPNDQTKFSLVYGARTPADLLLREQLDAIAKANPRVKVWYTVDIVPEGEDWPYSVGFVSEEMLKNHFPEAHPDVSVICCGPPPMLKFAVRPNLERLGFTDDQMFIF